jgi:hypothetical protein
MTWPVPWYKPVTPVDNGMIPPPIRVRALLFSENGVGVVVMIVPSSGAIVNC